jgi:alanyl-tRNA synthetase
MQRDEAEAEFGFRLYQGGAVPGKEIRIVEIDGGWDVEACGGTHLSKTSEAGLIKIVNSERVQDGIERLVFAVGPYALKEVHRRERNLMAVAEILGSPLNKVVQSVKNTVEVSRDMKRQLDRQQKEASKHTAEALIHQAIKVGDVKLIIHVTDEDLDFLIEVGNALEEIEQDIVAIMFSSDVKRFLVKAGQGALLKGVHAGNLTSKVAEIIGGRGGGQPHFGQGAGSNRKIFEASRIAFKNALEMQLELQP